MSITYYYFTPKTLEPGAPSLPYLQRVPRASVLAPSNWRLAHPNPSMSRRLPKPLESLISGGISQPSHPDPSDISSQSPSKTLSGVPSDVPSLEPSQGPSDFSSPTPSQGPSLKPYHGPSDVPYLKPSQGPSLKPSWGPSNVPSQSPSKTLSSVPSNVPSLKPSQGQGQSDVPSLGPSSSPQLPRWFV